MVPIKNILGQRAFIIPNNQRGYSWTKRQIQDLFDDLELMGNKCHYLGTIICSKVNSFTDEVSRETIISYKLEDGQQRLTTFLIILKLLKDRFVAVDDEETVESKELERLFSFYQQGQKLRVENENKDINEFMRQLLVIDGLKNKPNLVTPPMRRIQDAFDFIKAKLEAIDNKDKLIDLKNKLCNQALVIDVDLSDAQVDRYLTFDAINSRGLELTEFDKIKNFSILLNERQKLELEPDGEWYASITNIESFKIGTRTYENAFIAELFSVFHGFSASNSDVHDKFVKEYKTLLDGVNNKKANSLKNFISLWEDYSKSFAFVNSSNELKRTFIGKCCSKEAFDELLKLDRLNYRGITGSILVASHYSFSFEDFSKVAKACEIYTFRMHGICRYRVDKNSKAILKLSHQILVGKIEVEDVLKQIALWLSNDSSMAVCVEKLASTDLNYKNWTLTYYFLYEFEMSLSVQPTLPWAETDHKKFESIEHILPQNSRTAEWWKIHWPEELVAEKWSHRLGNLVLTNGNSILARKSIDKKLYDEDASYYYKHNNSTNAEKQIQNYTNGSIWQETQILTREISLLEFFVHRWAFEYIQSGLEVTVYESNSINIENLEGVNVQESNILENEVVYD